MAMPHEWHAGELYIQSQLGHKDAVAGAHPTFKPQLTVQHQQFHAQLNILPVCTLDARGRPWGSFFAAKDGQHGFISSPSLTTLIASQMKLHEHHPVEMALTEGAKFGMTKLVTNDDGDYQGPALKLIAGVGVMFENRRRNKLAGFINERNTGSKEDRTIQVEVMESLGNCPKYINTRSLVPNPNHNPTMLHRNLDLVPGQLLPEETLKHVAQADAVFLATRYTSPVQTIFKSHLGINIRGGKPGFVRITAEKVTRRSGETELRQVAYLPDYSGNRFMSSLGNVHSDKVAGITIPLMRKGQPIDVVYLTGDAEVLIGERSTSIFPGVRTCVRIELTGFMHVQDAVPLMPGEFDPSQGVEDFEPKGDDGIGWSPYNPPIRRLRSELTSAPDADSDQQSAGNQANIVAFEQHTPDLATITFRLSQPVRYRAGQHIILDCGSLLDAEVKEYKHMSDKYGGEQELNDTGMRTWTISSAPSSPGSPQDTVSVTMRKIDRGLVTPKMLAVAKQVSAGETVGELPVLGLGGDFVLPTQLEAQTKLLWIASGVGITPFLSFLASLRASTESVRIDVTMILAMRRAEAAAMLGLVRQAVESNSSSLNGTLSLHVVSAGVQDLDLGAGTTIGGLQVGVTKHSQRLDPELLLSISSTESESAGKPEAWVCGPASLETVVMQTLQDAGWPAEKLHRESFSF
ncbi:oxidoreductase FAD-binding protein [Moesziomyces antarcticus]|uniref:FAD-binding FR-type domain-containing protein n=1 Tax=Pseudozyma antarctica TaxID=84753 RepID=A0A5C3FGY9_PSEA2|nr:oxidoreductase FAD-binding protein [Moesziomyces antarcticus]GAK62089.1 oxidoreductase FAD-binding protein [Moesziomyces antarcticus]SPO42619.1 uncharacterized protein PSANT_00302 [Moesziomyces antarcticus]